MNMGLTTSNADRSHTSDVKTEEGAWYGNQYHNQQRANTIFSPCATGVSIVDCMLIVQVCIIKAGP